MTASELRSSTTNASAQSRVLVRVGDSLVELTGWRLDTEHRETGRFDPSTGQPLVEVVKQTLILETGVKS